VDDDAFTENSSRILKPRVLQFAINRELQRALKSRTAFTVVTITVERSTNAMPADERTLMKIDDLIEHDMRERDYIGHVEAGSTALVLLNSDYPRAVCVADRLVAGLERRHLPALLRITVGAACYPVHAMTADSLIRWALSHPISTWKTGRNQSGHER
jgi:GGDEF domain-containing protein